MLFSIVMPARNEAGCIAKTIDNIASVLGNENFDYEIIVVSDHCTDNTDEIVYKLGESNPRIKCVRNEKKPGFGTTIITGLNCFAGDAVAIYMADGSDSPADLVKYFRAIEAGADCVFGSRFINGSEVTDYPLHKLILNKLANFSIRILFRHGYNDTTNAFKCYRRDVINRCRPFISAQFNITVELPLKAFIRGFDFEIIPISWTNRKTGLSKLNIKEMCSRYMFTIAYCFLEQIMTGDDYRR